MWLFSQIHSGPPKQTKQTRSKRPEKKLYEDKPLSILVVVTLNLVIPKNMNKRDAVGIKAWLHCVASQVAGP